jgi:hypothetical protein
MTPKDIINNIDLSNSLKDNGTRYQQIYTAPYHYNAFDTVLYTGTVPSDSNAYLFRQYLRKLHSVT